MSAIDKIIPVSIALKKGLILPCPGFCSVVLVHFKMCEIYFLHPQLIIIPVSIALKKGLILPCPGFCSLQLVHFETCESCFLYSQLIKLYLLL